MRHTTAINCKGLSTELTLLRIKQALISGLGQNAKPLNVTVSKPCNRQQLMQSLGQQAESIQLV